MRSVEVGLLATRVLLGCAFALAGATKLVDVAGSTKAIHEVGAPGWLSALLHACSHLRSWRSPCSWSPSRLRDGCDVDCAAYLIVDG